MSNQENIGLFNGRVVIVTGASAGLGLAYAKELGRLGARVVVNGRTRQAVEHAVSLITEAGGVAVPCVADVRDGALIAQCALDHFGRVDALLSNAGIVRDRSFAKMNADEWDEVLRVHLDGTYSCVKAVWPSMQSQQYGRIVLTSSGAGMHGNYGQSNYATAKAGLIGLAKTLALEGLRYGIHVNALAPMALTQMNDSVFDAQMKETLSVDRIAPFAVALCHERMHDTGMVIEAGGGWGSALRWQRSAGLALADSDLSVSSVLGGWSALTSFDEAADFPASTADSLEAAVQGLRRVGVSHS